MKEVITRMPRIIRRIVAKRTKKTKTINILSKDTDFFVINNLAGNLYTPPSNLQYFVENVCHNYCKWQENAIKENVAKNPNINFETAKELLKDKNCKRVRHNLSKNQEAIKYAYIQEQLSNDNDNYTRYLIGRNTSLLYIMDKLSNDSDPRVRAGVAGNKNVRREKQKDFSTEVNHRIIIMALLKNSNVIPEILDEHANSPDTFFRLIVAGHLNTRIETLEVLKKDEDKGVRKFLHGIFAAFYTFIFIYVFPFFNFNL